MSELGDSKTVVKKCVGLEASQAQNKKTVVAEMSAQEDSIMKELNALRSKLAGADKGSGNSTTYAKATKTGQTNTNTAKGQNAKKKPAKPFTVDPERVAKRREWVYCHGCYTWGCLLYTSDATDE